MLGMGAGDPGGGEPCGDAVDFVKTLGRHRPSRQQPCIDAREGGGLAVRRD